VAKVRFRNNRRSFTLIECLLAMAVVCVCAFSFRHINRLYVSVMLAASADHVAAACHYLAHCAQARGVSTSLRIAGDNSYMLDDGNSVRTYTLPAGIFWGAAEGVYGPPSRPTELVTVAVVGGEQDDSGVTLRWAESGAQTPGTIYMHRGDDCAAITLPRAIDGVAHVYRRQGAGWVTRIH